MSNNKKAKNKIGNTHVNIIENLIVFNSFFSFTLSVLTSFLLFWKYAINVIKSDENNHIGIKEVARKFVSIFIDIPSFNISTIFSPLQEKKIDVANKIMKRVGNKNHRTRILDVSREDNNLSFVAFCAYRI